MFDFEIDPDIASRTSGLTMFSSKDDMDEVVRSVERLKKELKDINLVEFEDKGHFCFDDLKTNESPELLEEVLKQ